MARPRTILQDTFPYHVYGRCINKQWFDVPIDDVWQIFEEFLYLATIGFDARIHAFVLMNNHFHLLISTPRANLDRIMNYVLRETSRQITKRAGRINQTFGGPYKWSIVRTDIQFGNAYKYVYRNPVEAGRTNRCEDYRFSTLKGILGFEKLVIPTFDDILLSNSGIDVEILDWLNAGTREDFEAVKGAIKKSEFAYQVSKSSGHPIRDHDFLF
jgi:REP element-mobilizing transposase RayT